MKYIIGNWKSNKNLAQVRAWAQEFAGHMKNVEENAELKIVLCPSFVHLCLAQELLPSLDLGAQTLSPFPNGQYTGAVSALMVSEFVEFAIIGHAERRKFFAENEQSVANEAIQALENKMTPIVAVDDHNWSAQLSQLDDDQLNKVLVMYEPPEAISTSGQGHAADLEQVKKAIQLIKSAYSVKGVLYGGSVNATNIVEYVREPVIDGVVPGNASLDAKEFVVMIESVQKIL
jgi:triosephosphate isomerase